MDFLLAFVFGLLGFFSPCVIPLIPSHLAIIGGMSLNDMKKDHPIRKHALIRTFAFVLGIILPLVLLGFSSTLIGSFLSQYQTVITKILGLIVILFGFHLLGLLRLKVLNKELKFDKFFSNKKNIFSVFLLGAAFGFAWTPCIGPFLTSALILASQTGTMIKGGLLLFIYGIGLGVPFILIAYFSSYALEFTNKIKKHIKLLTYVSGVIMIIFGILLVTNKLVYLTFGI